MQQYTKKDGLIPSNFLVLVFGTAALDSMFPMS